MANSQWTVIIVSSMASALTVLFFQRIPMLGIKRHFQDKDEKQSELKEWYEVTQTNIGKLKHLIEKETYNPDLNYQSLHDELDSVYLKLATQADKGKELTGVSEETAKSIGSLATKSAKGAVIAEISNNNPGAEAFEKICEIRDRKGPIEITLEDVDRLLQSIQLSNYHFPSIEPEDVEDIDNFLEAADRLEKEVGENIDGDTNIFHPDMIKLMKSIEDDSMNKMVGEAMKISYNKGIKEEADKVSRQLSQEFSQF